MNQNFCRVSKRWYECDEKQESLFKLIVQIIFPITEPCNLSNLPVSRPLRANLNPFQPLNKLSYLLQHTQVISLKVKKTQLKFQSKAGGKVTNSKLNEYMLQVLSTPTPLLDNLLMMAYELSTEVVDRSIICPGLIPNQVCANQRCAQTSSLSMD